MKPLLFCPSPRNIPEVQNSWNDIPFDKFVVKNRLEHWAYQAGRKYFLDHPEYTHFVICPDDLVIDSGSFDILFHDAMTYDNVAGISNIDESQPDTYCCKPIGTSPESKKEGTFYTRDTLPNHNIFEVGFTGFTCQFISRKLMESLTLTGGCNDGRGCMDLQFTRECEKMGKKQWIDKRARFWHMRMAQYQDVRAWKNRGGHTETEGAEILLRGSINGN